MDTQSTPPGVTTPEDYGKKIFSPKNIILYLVVAVLAYGAMYFFFFSKKGENRTNSQTGSEQNQQQEASDESLGGPQPIFISLKAQNNSTQEGVALFAIESGKVKVSISLANTPDNAEPVHIHSGSCAKLGEIKYPLSDIVGGQSETLIDATLDDLKKTPLAVNVHKSAADLKTYVSCGDISS